MLVLTAMTSQVAQEVHRAALPRRAEDPCDRGLQAGMRVTDRQLHANQTARYEASEELGPERLGLRADVQADDLAPAGLVHGVRDRDALALNVAAVADLLDLRVDEHVRVAPLHGDARTGARALSKRSSTMPAIPWPSRFWARAIARVDWNRAERYATIDARERTCADYRC